MTNTEIISAIRNEIERLKGICMAQIEANPGQTFPFIMEMTGYRKLLSFLPTLESEKPVPKDLQEYASRAGFDYVDNIVQEHPGHRFNDHDVEFAYRDGIIAGAKWQKEQMLKEAVEGEVVKDISNKLAVTAKINLDGFKFGDKVRIIVLPKED